MESGINADQNFYSRRPPHHHATSTHSPPQQPQSEAQPQPQTQTQTPARSQPHQQPQAHYQHSQPHPNPHRLSHQHTLTHHRPPPLPDFEYNSRSPPSSPKRSALTADNLHDFAANGYEDGLGIADGDPAAFYRDYRGSQQPANGYTDIATNGMAAATSGSRPTPSSLRSNGNGTTPRHPPLAGRNAKPSYRSTSSPLEGMGPGYPKSNPALNGTPRARQTSVKELLKRFDPDNEPSNVIPRKPAPRTATKDGGAPGALGNTQGVPRYMTRTAASNYHLANTTRPGISTRDGEAGKVKSPQKPGGVQRSRFLKEDQHSNNTLSGVARSPRSRNSVSGNNPHGSQSMTNLSPTSPTLPSSNISPQMSGSRRQPLFGEVLSSGPGSDNIAHGIPHSATRRTSDSDLQPPHWAVQRSRSDADDFPSSPTAWYLGATSTLEDVAPNSSSHSSPSHNRNHSDLADTKVNTLKGVTPSFQPSTTSQPTSPQTRTASRLPVRTKRFSNSSESSSQPSTRAASPFATMALANGKKHEQHPWSPGARATTPTSRINISTQKSPRSRAQKAEAQKVEAQSNSSLPAYIKSPPAKTSPPLRSSRPRQPVSAATTTSSRQKARDHSTSPQNMQSGMKITRNGRSQEPSTGKKPDLASIDFVAQRDKVKRGITKSFQDAAAQVEIRAEIRRRREETQAKRLAEQNAETSQPTIETSPMPVVKVEPEPEQTPEPAPEPEIEGRSQTPLQITTSFSKAEPVAIPRENVVLEEDSPTLGVPGSFVDYDEPASAISNATAVTEIENEPQTEQAWLGRIPSVRRHEPSRLSSQIVFTADDLSPEQALFGINQEQESIDIMLAITPDEQPGLGLSLGVDQTRAPSEKDTGQDDRHSLGYGDQPMFASTLTTTSPETSPQLSGSVTPWKSDDGHINSRDGHVDYTSATTNNADLDPPPTSDAAEVDGLVSTDHSDGPQLQLPALRTALAPPSLSISETSHDYLHTPVTDMEDEGSEDMRISRLSRHSAYDSNEPNLPAPQVNRSSQQSSWTDYSIDSTRGHPRGSDLYNTTQVSLDTENHPIAPQEEQLESETPPVPPKPDGYSPVPSPRSARHAPCIPSPNGHQLPPISTGDGFAMGFSERARLSVTSGPLWQDYSPSLHPTPEPPKEPPILPPTRSPPPPNIPSVRPPADAYQPSHNGADYNSDSRRVSDDIYSNRPSESESRCSTQIPFEEVIMAHAATQKPLVPETDEEKEAAAKQKKRLFKRRMLIKELVDTESVYLKDMNVVEEIYKGTAEACPKLDAGDVKTIFRNSDEIVTFSTTLLDDLKSAAVAVYLPRAQKSRQSKTSSVSPSPDNRLSTATTLNESLQTDEQKDHKTFVGVAFGKHLKRMQMIYTDYLKNSETASVRLSALQTDGSVKVWLSECNIVAKDLTAAWDLDALLVKPVQRITRYQLLFKELLDQTREDHPDYEALQVVVQELLAMLRNIDELKKRIEMVGKIVNNRKRKDSDVRTGLAKAFGRGKEKTAEKLQANASRAQDDEIYQKLHERYGDDYLRLQVVLRDVEFYTRQVSTYVNDFLRYLSAMELVMRLTPSPWPELESKWARFNMSMRDMSTVALEEHINSIRVRVIEPFEKVIQAYGPPGLAMKKRAKRRIDYEKFVLSKGSVHLKLNDKDSAKVDQYTALNETLKLELPKLSALTLRIGSICRSNLVMIQCQWLDIWEKKVKTVLEESQIPQDAAEIVAMFRRDFPIVEAQAQELGIVNGNFNGVAAPKVSESDSRKSRPSNLSSRSRGLSLTSDKTPSLPTPDFPKRLSGHFSLSPTASAAPNVPQFAYQPQAYSTNHSRAGSGSPAMADNFAQPRPSASSLARPSTGRSFTSDNGAQRISNDYNNNYRRESASTYNSGHHVDGPPVSTRPYSGIFHSAMPMADGPEDSQRSSRNSSRDRNVSGGYNVLYLAASLFEFNISATKTEAGYPYLTYSAGEIFDVIGEKGELWLAKNQDDSSDTVGWIWSKHFARLAED